MTTGATNQMRPVNVAILFETTGFEQIVQGLLRDHPEIAVVTSGRSWPPSIDDNRVRQARVLIVERAWTFGSGNAVPIALLWEEQVDRIILCSLDDLTTTIFSMKRISNIDGKQFVAEIVSG